MKMTTAFGDMPWGIKEIKLKRNSTVVELPASMTLKFKEKFVSARGRGGNALRALAAAPDGVEWEMSALGLDLEAYALIRGLTVVETGVTPNQVKTLSSSNTNNIPYFDIYGRALGVGNDDIHYHIINAKLTEGLDAPFEDGKLTESALKGEALDWEMVQNETATEIDTDGSGS
jgi:hypothetical protein